MALSGFTSSIVSNPQIVEYGKFVRIDDDTRFPAVSVTNFKYPDTTAAYPGNSATPVVQSIDIYPKYAVLNYVINTQGSGGYDYATAGSGLSAAGGYSGLLTLSATTIAGITAKYSPIDNLAGVTLPAGITFNAPIIAIRISSGSAILYKIE
jgi:hypothetical protein